MSDRKWPRPQVVVSKCLGFEACRYNAQMIEAPFLDDLAGWADLKPVCPEMEIGLGVPRRPIRLVREKDDLRLIQPAIGRDLTVDMARFVEAHLGRIGPVDGFILKSRSPSCGYADVRIYGPGDGAPALTGKAAGAFGGPVLERRPEAAVIDEARLTNLRLREHFLTKLFTLASLRQALETGRAGAIVEFQAANKLLLMTYNQTEMRRLGRIAANADRRPIREVAAEYAARLPLAFGRAPSRKAAINTLMHALGYFKKGLAAGEKAHFLDLLEAYRAEQVPLSAPLQVVGSWVSRFSQAYLAGQTFFAPFPPQLIRTADSGRPRRL